MECHLKWNVTKSKISLKIEFHSKLDVTQNGMSLKWGVSLNEMSLK